MMLPQAVSRIDEGGQGGDAAVFFNLNFDVPAIVQMTMTAQQKDQQGASRKRHGGSAAQQIEACGQGTGAEHDRRRFQDAAEAVRAGGDCAAEQQQREMQPGGNAEGEGAQRCAGEKELGADEAA